MVYMKRTTKKYELLRLLAENAPASAHEIRHTDGYKGAPSTVSAVYSKLYREDYVVRRWKTHTRGRGGREYEYHMAGRGIDLLRENGDLPDGVEEDARAWLDEHQDEVDTADDEVAPDSDTFDIMEADEDAILDHLGLSGHGNQKRFAALLTDIRDLSARVADGGGADVDGFDPVANARAALDDMVENDWVIKESEVVGDQYGNRIVRVKGKPRSKPPGETDE